jgi:hypothetical protein
MNSESITHSGDSGKDETKIRERSVLKHNNSDFWPELTFAEILAWELVDSAMPNFNAEPQRTPTIAGCG